MTSSRVTDLWNGTRGVAGHMRNAANKIMVSLGVDAPLVTDGTELFSVDADGQTVSAQ